MTTPIREIAAGIPAAQSTPLSLTPTAQEIFDKVLNHLRTQGKAAVDDEGTCAYRGEGGTSCAVGCLIPDALYSSEFENKAVAADVFKKTLEALGLTGHIKLLRSLQSAHDGSLHDGSVGRWEVSMESIAEANNLTYTGPTT